jgi:hypothetical protein
MHRILITLLAAVLVGGSAFAQSFPDIPANHWAGDAVEEIADLGIVIGFPDGTFRGNEAFTRYQSALVVSRLLAVVDANMDAAMAGMDADLAGLRAAMQDLASDVAAQGVRLAAAESAVAGISDDVAANSGRIGALEDALAGLEAAMADSAVLRDLQNQIASQRVAIDTAQAQAEAAAARADAAYDLALQGLAESDGNANDIAALNRALQILSDRVDGMSGPVAMPDPFDPSGLQAGIDGNAGDIANIREFVILLRRDQVAMRDRISALEAADAATSEAIAGLDARVATLERTALQISGSISLVYNVNRFAACVVDCGFDVDRVYGLGFRRDMGASFVSTGTNPTDGFASAERPAQRRPEFTQGNGFTSTLSISVIGNQAFDGTSQPRGLDAFSAVADLDFRQAFNLDANAGGTSQFSGYVLRVKSFTTTFDPIGSEPLTFRFGSDINTRTISSAYTFDVRGEAGYLATLGAPEFLAFLSPTLWIAYTDPNDDGENNRTAIRGTMAPSLGDAVELMGGFTFARSTENTLDKDDVLANNDETIVWGVDGEAMLLGIVGLEFEYASNLADANSVLFVKASVDGSALPILESLDANYRAIAADWDGISSPGNADPSTSAGYPFAADQSGFGVEGSLGLFILEISAFFDSYSVTTPAAETISAFGVYGSADLFAGFSLGAFFESVSVGGAVADTNDVADLRRASRGYTNMDGVYETQFGVTLSHDGAADNALIADLDIDVEYRRFNADFSGSDLDVFAQYELDVAFVALQPYVGYRMYDDNRATRSQYNELIAGTGLQTTSFDFGVVSPSLVAAVNYRNTSYGADNTAGTFVATELQWSVGVVLDEFLLGEYSTLSARYGSYSGTNVAAFASAPVANPVPRVGREADADLGGATTSTTGYEVQWNYYDLVFAYANYTTTDGTDPRSAQQFRVTYTVDF